MVNKSVLGWDNVSHHCINPMKSSSATAVAHPNVGSYLYSRAYKAQGQDQAPEHDASQLAKREAGWRLLWGGEVL